MHKCLLLPNTYNWIIHLIKSENRKIFGCATLHAWYLNSSSALTSLPAIIQQLVPAKLYLLIELIRDQESGSLLIITWLCPIYQPLLNCCYINVKLIIMAVPNWINVLANSPMLLIYIKASGTKIKMIYIFPRVSFKTKLNNKEIIYPFSFSFHILLFTKVNDQTIIEMCLKQTYSEVLYQ